MGGFPAHTCFPALPRCVLLSGSHRGEAVCVNPRNRETGPLQKASRPRVCSPVCWVSADNWEQVMCKLGTGRAIPQPGEGGHQGGHARLQTLSQGS